jgi:hypothetical protein
MENAAAWSVDLLMIVRYIELLKCPEITEVPFKVTEMSNGKAQCPGIRCVILLQTFSENFMKIG